MNDNTNHPVGLILSTSRSIESINTGLIERGLELAGKIIRSISANDYFESGKSKEYIDFKGAIDDFTRAIQIDPCHIRAYYYRGEAESELGNYQSAIDDYTKVIELDPECLYYYEGVWGFSSRGQAKIQLGDYQGAIDDFTKAVEIERMHESPENIHSYNALGWAKIDLGDYQGAIEHFTKMIESYPDELKYFARGIAKYELGQYRRAIQDFTMAIKYESHICPSEKSYYWRAQAVKKYLFYIMGEHPIKICGI